MKNEKILNHEINKKNLIEEIKNEIDTNKQFIKEINPKKFIDLINQINNNYNVIDIYDIFYNALLNKLNDIDFEDIIKLNKILTKFNKINKPKYKKMIKNKDWLVFEYDNRFEWIIINNNINILEIFNFLFNKENNLNINFPNVVVYIDRIERKLNLYDFDLLEFKLATNIKIKILKQFPDYMNKK